MGNLNPICKNLETLLLQMVLCASPERDAARNFFFETNRPQTCSPSGVGKKIFDVNRQLAEQPWQVFPQCGQDTCPCSSSCVDSRHDGQYNIVRQHAVPIFVLPILKELRVNMRSVDSNLGKIFPQKKNLGKLIVLKQTSVQFKK